MDFDAIQERRVYPRADIDAVVSLVARKRSEEIVHEARTLNVGAGGALVEIDTTLPLKSEILVAIDLGAEPLVLKGKVIRVIRGNRDRVRLGIRFDGVPATTRRLLVDHVDATIRGINPRLN